MNLENSRGANKGCGILLSQSEPKRKWLIKRLREAKGEVLRTHHQNEKKIQFEKDSFLYKIKVIISKSYLCKYAKQIPLN